MGGHLTHDSFACSGATNPISAKKRNDLTFLHVDVNTLKDMRFTLIGMKIFDF